MNAERGGPRRRVVSGLLATLLTAVLAVLLAGPATAAGSDGSTAPPPVIGVDSVDVTPGHGRLVLSTANLPPGAGSDIRVSADGVPIPAHVTPLDPGAPAATAAHRAVVLLLDTSGSMAGSGIAAARQAALAYLRTLPPDVQVGLVAFSDRPALLVAPTTDRNRLAGALAAVHAQGNTALYDAVGVAVNALEAAGLGPTAQHRLVVLSDGVDTSSTTSLAAVRDQLAARHIPTDVVAFRYGPADTSALDGLAAAAGGKVLAADNAAALASAFARIASSFDRRLAVTLDVPADLAGKHATLAISLGGATATTLVSFVTVQAAAPGSPSVPWALVVLAVLVFTALLLAVLLGIGALRPDDRGRHLLDRIGRYGPRRVQAEAPGEGTVARTAVDWASSLLRSSKVEQPLTQRLDLAGITRKPGEWALLCGCAVVVAAAALTLLTGNAFVGLLVGGLVGWLGMRLSVSTRIARRRAAFGEQLPDVLQLVAGSLQAGFSLPQALDAVVREGTQPAAGEVSRALAETRIGIELEVALDRVAYRMLCNDLRWVVMAIRIQREVGGNLAEVLLNTVATMRERAQLRRHVRALSAEGRLSAYILIALPVLVGAWLFLGRGDYVRPLYTTGVGVLMLGGGVVLVVVGALWMRKLVKVEV